MHINCGSSRKAQVIKESLFHQVARAASYAYLGILDIVGNIGCQTSSPSSCCRIIDSKRASPSLSIRNWGADFHGFWGSWARPSPYSTGGKKRGISHPYQSPQNVAFRELAWTADDFNRPTSTPKGSLGGTLNIWYLRLNPAYWLVESHLE